MNKMTLIEIPETMLEALRSNLTTIVVVTVIVAIILVSLYLVITWKRRKRINGAVGGQQESLESPPEEITEENILLEIRSEIEPIRGKLEKLEGMLTHLLQTYQQPQKSIDDNLRRIRKEVLGLSSKLDKVPYIVGEELRKHLEREKQRKEEELNRTREASRSRLSKRLDRLLERYPVFQISTHTKTIIQELRSTPHSARNFEESFSQYLQVASRGEELRKILADSEAFLPDRFEASEDEIEGKCESLKRDLDALSNDHRVIWFIDLIEDAGRYPSLRGETTGLKNLLGLEEIHVSLGSEATDMQDLDVVGTEGMGRRAVISEVLENGYTQRETRAVLRRPKVRIRLET